MLVHTQEQGQTFFMTRAQQDNIDQFQYVKIHPQIIDISTRLQEITTEFVGIIPWRVILRSIVLGWILMLWSWHIECCHLINLPKLPSLEIHGFSLHNAGSVSWKTVRASGQSNSWIQYLVFRHHSKIFLRFLSLKDLVRSCKVLHKILLALVALSHSGVVIPKYLHMTMDGRIRIDEAVFPSMLHSCFCFVCE